MKYIAVDIWDSEETKNTIFDRVKTEQFDKFILFCQHEWKYWNNFGSHTFADLANELDRQGKILYTTTVSPKIFEEQPQYQNVRVETWPTYWFIKTYLGLNDYNRIRKEYKINIDDIVYKKHFISMNHRPHPWRCEMIDLVSKYNLIDNNAISWMNAEIRHPFKYFNLQRLTLDKDYGSTLEQYELPNEYYETFAQLISESTTECIFITEKTAIPLLVGKPFLVATCPGYHKYLKQLGFELYDEIFDYSFDSEVNQETRFEMVVKNFKRLSTIPVSELHTLNYKIKDKIIHNRQLAEHMVFDRSYYPKIALEIMEHYEKTGEEVDKWIIGIHRETKR